MSREQGSINWNEVIKKKLEAKMAKTKVKYRKSEIGIF
jgi:hypothetical protein